MIVKGPITKIHSYDDPKVFNVKNSEDKKLFRISYNGFLPIRENDIVCCKVVKGKENYQPVGKPLVIIPCNEQTIKNSIFKAFRGKKAGVGSAKVEKFYDELYAKQDPPHCEEKIVEYLNNMEYDDVKFENLTSSQANMFLNWWHNNYSLRRLYLLGINKTEIRGSKMGNHQLYETLKFNPFTISCLSLEKATEISKLFGKEVDQEKLNCGAVLRYIERVTKNGSLCCQMSQLKKEFPAFDSMTEKLTTDYSLVIENDLVYTSQTYDIENYVAQRISAIVKTDKEERGSLLPGFKESYRVFPEPGFVLTKEQEQALKGCMEGHISLITGGAGCGKTTLIKQIIKNFEEKGESYILTSLTGKAVLRMKEVTGVNENVAYTMHRLIFNYKFGKVEKCKFYNLIIDETSMVSTELMYDFFKVFKHHFRIICVGDSNQLSPMGRGDFFKELINSGVINVYKLNINKRFENNGILPNANGLISDQRDKNVPFQFVSKDGFYFIEGGLSMCNLVLKKLSESNVDQEKITVLSPKKMHIPYLVDCHRKYYLPGKKSFTIKDMSFALGDRVMQTRNAYIENSFDIMNGEEGYITNIDEDCICVDFENNVGVKYSWTISEPSNNPDIMPDSKPEDLCVSDIKPSFAKTIHCSQGSEYDYVILYIPENCNRFITINLLYTALTRAKEKIWIIGNKSTLDYATTNFDNCENSQLGTKIKNYLL